MLYSLKFELMRSWFNENIFLSTKRNKTQHDPVTKVACPHPRWMKSTDCHLPHLSPSLNNWGWHDAGWKFATLIRQSSFGAKKLRRPPNFNHEFNSTLTFTCSASHGRCKCNPVSNQSNHIQLRRLRRKMPRAGTKRTSCCCTFFLLIFSTLYFEWISRRFF